MAACRPEGRRSHEEGEGSVVNEKKMETGVQEASEASDANRGMSLAEIAAFMESADR